MLSPRHITRGGLVVCGAEVLVPPRAIPHRFVCGFMQSQASEDSSSQVPACDQPLARPCCFSRSKRKSDNAPFFARCDRCEIQPDDFLPHSNLVPALRAGRFDARPYPSKQKGIRTRIAFQRLSSVYGNSLLLSEAFSELAA